MNRPPEVVLFDLDDTLIDYSGGVETCWAAACEHAATIGLDPRVVTQAVHDERIWFWNDRERHARERIAMLSAWTKIVAGALVRCGRPSELVARAVATDFATRRMNATSLFDDALPCLDALRARGVVLGLVTNGDAGMQREKLARFALAPYFDVIAIEGELGTGKPGPAVYRHVLETLAVDPAATTMVGDNLEWDVVGPQAVGITGVWIDRDGQGLPADTPAVRVIRSLAELVG